MKPAAVRLDRAAVMRDAHRRFRDGRRLGLGWSWSQCLTTAWAAAKMRQEQCRCSSPHYRGCEWLLFKGRAQIPLFAEPAQLAFALTRDI